MKTAGGNARGTYTQAVLLVSGGAEKVLYSVMFVLVLFSSSKCVKAGTP